MNYCKKNCGVMSFVLILILILSSSFCYAEQDREAQQAERDRLTQEKVTAAEQDIDTKLTPVLEHINTGDEIAEEDIAVLKDILKSNLPYVLRMQPTSQSKFYVLSAWTNYYANENQKAVQDSAKAFKADSDYADARSTVAAMALMNRDYASLAMLKSYYQKKERPKQPRQSPRTAPTEQPMMPMPGGMPGPMAPMPAMDAPAEYSSGSTSSSGEGVLNINVESLVFDVISKPAGVENLVCLNHENLDMSVQGRFYCILLWKTNYLDTAEARQKSRLFENGNETPSQTESATGEKSPDFEAFKSLYRRSIPVGNTSFVVVNTDRKSDWQALADFLLINSGPWANAVLLDQSNKMDSILGKIKIDGPILILVRDNSVLYAGSAEGILPAMIMKKLIGATLNEPVTPAAAPLEPTADSNVQTQVQDSNENVKQESAPVIQEKQPEPKPKDESQLLTESVEAQNLYQLAEIHFKKGRYIGYGKCVDACREIIVKYPSTVEAQKAKEMLRQLPSDKRKLYGITDEELAK